MDYYFCAANADEARAIRERGLDHEASQGGVGFIEAKDIIACPHLDQLVEAASGQPSLHSTDSLVVVWPPAGTPPPTDLSSPFLTDPSIMQLPNTLRDALAAIEVTPHVAQTWHRELWGFEVEEVERLAHQITRLSRSAQQKNQHLYCWSEM